MSCLRCGYEPVKDDPNQCPLCTGLWETWELMWPALPLPKNREQVAAWISQLPLPVVVDLNVKGGEGLRVRLHAPPGAISGAVAAWASMNHQQTNFVRSKDSFGVGGEKVSVLRNHSILPNLVIADSIADPMLAIGGRLLSGLPDGKEAGLRIWLLSHDPKLQAKIRELAAYSYGTSAGVDHKSAPNPWGLRFSMFQWIALLGMGITAISTAIAVVGVIPFLLGLAGALAGLLIFVSGVMGVYQWMKWRAIPQEILKARATDTLIKTAIVAYGYPIRNPAILSGSNEWHEVDPEWPAVKPNAFPLPVQELASLITSPEIGEGGGILARSSIQDVPAAPASESLLVKPGDTKIPVGKTINADQTVGIDPDGHVLIVGGTRSGKSSFTYDVLRELIQKGNNAPGIFLVDPHLSLSDAFLQEISGLPEPLRAKAVERLRIITVDQPEVVPLNLLTLKEYSWAGNAIVQIGRRIWDDYWGPRMQAALLGLFRLAHAWNQEPKHEDKLGLIHVVFSAFNMDWRHEAMSLMPPVERIGSIGLDALLGQFGSDDRKWDQGWITEVISPVLSKVMALELSPWLFAALHQRSFVDLERWIKERAWIVLRLPAGEMGKEAARLTAGVVYNVFDAVFHKVALKEPTPYYFIIDEAQEIATGMRIESMLSEGAKFGARMFILTQSLAMMRQIEGFEPVVQALLANTSTQAFFSVGPEDAEIVHETLNTTSRFGVSTLDLPTLQCWLRARVNGKWQAPTLIKVAPLIQPVQDNVQKLIREAIDTHPADYIIPDAAENNMVRAMLEMIPPNKRNLLDIALASDFTEKRKPSNLDQENREKKKVQNEDIPEEIARRGERFQKVFAKSE